MPAPTRALRLVMVSLIATSLALAAIASAAPAPQPARGKLRSSGDPVPVTVTATLRDSVVTDTDDDDAAVPGDTIRYRLQVTNHGSTTTLDVGVDLDAQTTLAPGTTNVSPLAFDDSYTAVGNTELIVGGPPGTEPAVRRSGSLFDNDVEFLGDTYALQSSSATSAQGGAVQVQSDGSFSYLPPVGFTGNDSFTYTIVDGKGLTGTATVSIVVAQRVWYVNSFAAPGGDGRSTSPFDALATVNGAGGSGDPDASNDFIFLEEATPYYEGGIELEPGQRLIGQGADLVVDPGDGPVTIQTATNRPSIQAVGYIGVLLSTNNVVKGVHVISQGANGITGASFGSLTIDRVSIETAATTTPNDVGLYLNQGGPIDVNVDSVQVNDNMGVHVANVTGTTTLSGLNIRATVRGLSFSNAGTLAVLGDFNTVQAGSGIAAPGAGIHISHTTIASAGLRFRSITAENLDAGIALDHTGSLGGILVTGRGVAKSGGVLFGCDVGVALDDVRSASLSSMLIRGSAGANVQVDSLTQGLNLSQVVLSDAQAGLFATNVLGNSTLNGCTIDSARVGAGLQWSNTHATNAAPGPPDKLTIRSCTITRSLEGAFFQASGTSNVRYEVVTSNLTSNSGDGINFNSTNTALLDFRLSSSTITGGVDGIFGFATGSSKSIVDIRNASGSSGHDFINLANGASGTLEATLDGGTITASTTGRGIIVTNQGTGPVIARIANFNVSGTFDNGIRGSTAGGSLSLTITGNTVSAPTGVNPTHGIAVATQAPGASVCLNLANNTSSGGSGGSGYVLAQTASSTFRLQDFTGSGTSSGDVATWVNSVKNNTGSVAVSFAGGFSTSSGCATPAPPPSVVAVAEETEFAAPAVAAGAPGSAAWLATPAPARDAALRASGPIALGGLPVDFTIPIGTFPGGKTLTVLFDVTVNDPLSPPATQVAAQGEVVGDFGYALTDDPDTAPLDDPTITPIRVSADLGAEAILAPTSGCRLGSAPVTIRIRNFAGAAQTGFDVAYSVTGAASAGPVVENVGALSVPEGGTAEFTFTTPVDLSTLGSYTVHAETRLSGDGTPANDGVDLEVAHRPAPTADAGPDRLAPAGTQVVLGGDPTADGTTGPFTYSWTPTSGLDDPLSANPVATVSGTVLYTLVVTDAFGCTATDQVAVTQATIATLARRLSGSSNDAEENRYGSVDLSSGDLELVEDDGERQTVGLRFTNVTIPAGSDIARAWVQFTADESQSGPIEITIKGQLAPNPGAFTSTRYNITSRPTTDALATWSPGGWSSGQAGFAQRTVDLAAIVREIVGQTGWNSGQALVLTFRGFGRRTAESVEGGSSLAAVLHVEYAVDPNQPPVVDAGPGQTITLPDAATLHGTVDDDGLPPGGTVTTRWEQASGPGTVTFGDADAVDTQASFSRYGTYVLRLTASDGAKSARDSVTIVVRPAGTPGTLDRRVAAGSDDAEQGPSGSVDVSSDDLDIVMNSSDRQTVGVRFRNVTIPADALITAAWIQFRADESQSGATALLIEGQASANALAFTTARNNLSVRPRTLSVAWSPPAWSSGAAGAAQRTPDLAEVVQAILGQGGWTSGNAMAFLITGNGRRTAESYEGTSSGAPLLHVEYVIPPAPAPLALGGEAETDAAAAVDLGPSRARPVPNPTRGLVSFELTISRPGKVKLEVFDVQGRRLATPLDEARLGAGSHTVRLAQRLQAGLYFYRLQAPDRAVSGRVMVVE